MLTKDLLKNVKLFSQVGKERTECETGFVLERRSFLWLPLLAAGSLIPGNKIFAADRANLLSRSMVWEDFLKECLPKASELHKDTTAQGQDAYLFWIASVAARLNLLTVPAAKTGKFKNLEPPVEFGVGYRGIPFFVVEWKMSPNSYFPPHNHPNASVCTIGIEGEARIRNFEGVGDLPEFSSKEKFEVRETHNEIISAGRINMLSAARDNIHTFQVSSSGARGIDITTYHGENVGFSFLDISDKPFEPAKRLFEATWKKL
ncbi:MAG: hypothetical protein R2681_08155 [Pyrinomonadaceae bacterium]